MSARRGFTVELWLRKAKVDEPAAAASVSHDEPLTETTSEANAVDETSVGPTTTPSNVMTNSRSTAAEESTAGTSNAADDEDDEDEVQAPVTKKRKIACTSYDNYTWIVKTDDGYVCKVCQQYGIKGLHDIYKLLLLPIGTATVERSFSTMNRILNSKRCRLLPEHTCQLMQLAVEGPCVPDVRDAKEDDLTVFNEFLEKAYRMWMAKPRRGLQ